MLRKLEILILLVMIADECLSAPPNCTYSGPKKRSDLQRMAQMLNTSHAEFQKMVKSTPFRLGEPITAFGKKLLNEILENPLSDDDNVVVSPLSVFTAILMMWYASPQGTDTHTQIADALDLNVAYSDAYLWNNLKLMTDYSNKETTTLELANGIFLEKGFPIQQDYEDIVKGYFLSKVENFLDDRVLAANEINEFVKQKTRDMIKQVVSPDSITSRTTMILVNAFYFKGLWKCKFDEKNTTDMEFNLPGGKGTVTVPGMSQTSTKLQLAELVEFDCRVLELPFEDGDIVMYVLLTNKNDLSDLNFAMENIDFALVERRLMINSDGIWVKMPRMETSWEKNLAAVLVQLGVKDLFSDADLSELTKKCLSLQEILHKSAFKVDEEGAKTAATTTICFLERGKKDEPEKFFVDRPFGFFIRDKRRGITLSAGRILNPLAGKDNPDTY